MTEPSTKASAISRVVPTVHRWWLEDDRIGGGESDAYAIVKAGWVTLIDPLPIDEERLRRLGKVEAIVLSASCHQRSAWRLRRLFGVKVYAPQGAVGLEEEPDQRYGDGDALPGGLTAFHAPGPTEAMYALWLARPRHIVFLADLLWHDGSGIPGFVEAGYQDDPARTRVSVRRILEQLPVEVLCFNHGPPILDGAREALAQALAQDKEPLPARPAPSTPPGP